MAKYKGSMFSTIHKEVQRWHIQWQSTKMWMLLTTTRPRKEPRGGGVIVEKVRPEPSTKGQQESVHRCHS